MHGYISKSPNLHQGSISQKLENPLFYMKSKKKNGFNKRSSSQDLELNNTMEQEDYSEEQYSEVSTKKKTSPTPKKKRCENNKRFTDEQVKLLESIFGQGTKLDPRKKIQIARDLGLQPRQVSIWFQNKRARWKSKQMEQEYRVLKDNFDALNQKFECLKKENQSLLEQIQTRRSLLENSHGRHSSSNDSTENGAYIDSGNRNGISELKENDDRALFSDEDERGIDKCLRENHKKEEIQFLIMSEHGSSSLASPDQQWCNLPSGCLLDESCCPSGWWNL